MIPGRWSRERASTWFADQPWLVGCNFIPSTAINPLEMWQAGTFDPETLRRELGWAAGLGFNSVRVYLHDLAWLADPGGLKSRIDQYLEIAARVKIRTLFVLLDDCWDPEPQIGPQPAPRPGLHNSGWVQSPGVKVVKNPQSWGRLEDYIGDIVTTFGRDERVVMWDVYNEPGNYFLTSMWLPALPRMFKQLALLLPHLLLPVPSLPLLRQAFSWARAAQPAQPLTAGLWLLRPGLRSHLSKTMLQWSDVISFHDYNDRSHTGQLIQQLKAHGRPLFCTEYLARTRGNLFTTHLPLFKGEKIGCYNWGLVSGKTQALYTWEGKGGPEEPEVWFHDILRADGTAHDPEEVAFIRRITEMTGPLESG